jgi:hypothetical protein
MLLVLLHLIVVPCATAMQLMPADSQCEHCQTPDSPGTCVVASAATDSAIQGVAFDSGRAVQPVLFSAALPSAVLTAVDTPYVRPQSFASRHSGDPPLYLIFGQLLI